jgi:hypothetical protein
MITKILIGIEIIENVIQNNAKSMHTNIFIGNLSIKIQ